MKALFLERWKVAPLRLRASRLEVSSRIAKGFAVSKCIGVAAAGGGVWETDTGKCRVCKTGI